MLACTHPSWMRRRRQKRSFSHQNDDEKEKKTSYKRREEEGPRTISKYVLAGTLLLSIAETFFFDAR